MSVSEIPHFIIPYIRSLRSTIIRTISPGTISDMCTPLSWLPDEQCGRSAEASRNGYAYSSRSTACLYESGL